ncbi:MAG: hypothetical protein RSE16_00945 [Sphingobium sp.]|jgi:hypothetical protein|nr:MAG: hypothetical protein RSE16_00945 [Sphingobium sp.]
MRFLAFVFLLSSCVRSDAYPKIVTEEQYLNIDKCWKNKEGRISAFIVLSELDESYSPFFISPFCKVEKKGVDFTIGGSPSLKVSGDNGLAKLNSFIKKPISSNIKSDIISDKKSIYLFSGNLKKIYSLENRQSVYEISDIFYLFDAKISELEFGKFDAKDRYRFFQSKSNRANNRKLND